MRKQSADINAIRKLAQAWRTAWNRGDAEALLSLYADKPILMPQGHPAVAGRKNIRSLYQSLFREFDIKGKGKVMEIEVSGDWGYFWSSYSLTAAPKAGGKKIRGKGKSLFIVKRQNDNSWKITRVIDNSDREESAGE